MYEWEVFPVKKIVAFLMVVVLGVASRGATAQDLFESQTLGELPAIPQPEPTADISNGHMLAAPESMELPPVQETITLPATSGDLAANGVETGASREWQLFDCEPALMESTGTWLRRGFWFAEADAVIFRRSFDRDGIALMQSNPLNNFPALFPRNILAIDGSKPGAETTPRIKVGRFLFRDKDNRDHNLEFIAFGGGNFSQEGRLDEPDGLFTPTRISGPNISFTGATSSQYRYDSFFNTFELNYHLHSRMMKDRMELEPNGDWVRRAQPTTTRSFLAGLRYFNLDEHLNWTAFGIPNPDDNALTETGLYDIRTGNNMIGTQMGVSSSYDTARWSIGGEVKGGMFVNMIDLDSSFSITDGVTSGSNDLQRDNISWVGEAKVIGKYHIRPNFSIRTAFEVMHLAGIALATSQIDFVPSGSPFVSQNNDAVYLGGSIGFEGYW
jgi:hypothetical protein